MFRKCPLGSKPAGNVSTIANVPLLLDTSEAQRLYGKEEGAALSYESGFIQRIREMIRQCCEVMGVEETCHQLRLPRAIGDYLIGSFDPPAKPKETIDERAIEILHLPEEDKKLVVQMYLKGIRITYIATLFGITNAKVINSWGDWRKRPRLEAQKFLERRARIQQLLDQGMSVKEARDAYKLTNKAYREVMGIPRHDPFPLETYEAVVLQLQQCKAPAEIAEKTGVPVYLVQKWAQGKAIPQRPVLFSDSDASAETRATVIKKFYETGSTQQAADSAGVSPQVVEQWVMKYQKTVSDQETRL